MANTVGKKGQVVIEKPLREALGVQPGFVTVQTVINGHLEIQFFPPEHNQSLRGALKTNLNLSTEELREARERALQEAVMEDWNRRDEET
jgi:bifunctional DNA-binding transcriptional regulator/antitoxin component of YhaV-PrlF toxin-antitoxin module